MRDITIRFMAEGDLPGADNLRRLAGWNQTPEDWARMLRWEPDGCFVAIRDGNIVGTVTTTTYGRALAWVGMMLVHPEHRRRGIGRRLMEQALQSLRGKQVRCVKLDATPAGFPLYERLGLITEWTLTRYQRPPSSNTVPGSDVTTRTRGLSETDWPVVEKIDADAIGASRARLLRDMARASQLASVWPVEGTARGWGLLRPGACADYLGPVACGEDEGSISLVTALLAAAGARSVFWDVPDHNSEAQKTAGRFGFTPIRPLTRMCLGSDMVVGTPHAQFAIADPAVG